MTSPLPVQLHATIGDEASLSRVAGVGVGSSLAELLAAFGEPDDRCDSSHGTDEYMFQLSPIPDWHINDFLNLDTANVTVAGEEVVGFSIPYAYIRDAIAGHAAQLPEILAWAAARFDKVLHWTSDGDWLVAVHSAGLYLLGAVDRGEHTQHCVRVDWFADGWRDRLPGVAGSTSWEKSGFDVFGPGRDEQGQALDPAGVPDPRKWPQVPPEGS